MEPEAPRPDKTVPIAIIGMACRFPGDGTNTTKLFEMLQNGVSAWSEFPEDRVNIDGFYHPSGSREGSIPFRGAHFLKGDVAAFDAPFFNISANEAKAIDPQQRILLEVTYEALENAGVPVESIDGSETTVNVGSFVKDYEQIVLRDPDWSPQYAATGTGAAILANRISHTFNLMGPSQTIDTGCSGSLIAVHNCCLDLQTGRSSLAIAAGVGMILTPATMMPMTALNFLSPDGKCFTFSEKANGYGRGEGVGVVVLKRLDDALRDNDTIRAVVRGSRTNQDGRTPGITMPSSESQLSNIRAVYEEAGLDVGQTAFVECHGTGTQAGDPKEVKAIYRAFCEDRARDRPIVVGSIKPNVGHLEGAAGVAGLIKATLSVEHGTITKNLHFEPPGNPAIPFGEWNVQVPTETMPWPLPGLRRAGVNCFGFGGSNCHVIIDDAHHYLQQRSLAGKHQTALAAGESSGSRPPEGGNAAARPHSSHLFVFSSHEKSGIRRIAESQLDYVRQNITTPDRMADYAYTLSCRRSRLEHGAFVVATAPEELVEQMARLAADGASGSAAPETPPRVALVFCGQGAQWHAMGRELMQWPLFRRSILDATEYILSLGSTFDLHHELVADERWTRIGRPRIAQPATTAVQIALVELLRAFGVVPVATVGHSSGEIAAAYAAGHLSREDAWNVAFQRGHHVAAAGKNLTGRKGAMLAAGLSPADAQHYLDAVPDGSVCVACYNSPSSVTLSGDQDQVRSIARRLDEQGVFNRLLHVSTAYHSPQMQGVGAAYRASIAGVAPKAGDARTEMFSSSRCWQREKPGAVLGGTRSLRGRSSELDADYWAQNLVEPVYFDCAFEEMCRKHKPDLVIEVSPSVALRRSVQEISKKMAPSKPAVPCIPMLEKDKHAARTTLAAIGELWQRGYPVDLLRSLTSDGSLPQALADMPPYPWNHSRSYWHESHLGRALRFRKHGREDLIGAPTADSSPREPRWRGFFRLSENPWMQDHQVQKTVVYPAAGLIVMALEAAKQSAEPGMDTEGFEVTDFAILKPVVIPASDHGLEHALNAKALRIAADDGGRASTYAFTIYTKPLDAPWQENAHGSFVIWYKSAAGAGASHTDEAASYRRCYDAVLSRCEEEVAPRHLYEKLDIIGMNYGPLFQNITCVKRRTGKCSASAVKVPNTKDRMPGKYEYDHTIHPATLDSIFQTVFAVGEEAMVPSTCKSIYVSSATPRGAGRQLVGYATAERKGLRGATADIVMAGDQWDKPLVIVKGLDFTSLAATRDDSGFLPSHRNLCSEIVWAQDVELARPETMQEFLCLLAYKRPDLRILQVDQDAMLAYEVLSVLSCKGETPLLSRYTILSDSDSVAGEVARMDAAERWDNIFGHATTLEEGDHYDVVLVSTNTDRDPRDIAKHLAPNCTVLLSAPGPGREFDTTVAVALEKLTRTAGLRTHSSLVRRVPTGIYCFITTRRPSLVRPSTKNVAILVNGGSANQAAIARGLSSELEGSGVAATIETLEAGVDEDKLYISLLDVDMDEPFLFTVGEGAFERLHKLLLKAAGLLWVTRGSQMVVDNPRAAPFHALARTIRSEDASKKIVTLDIDADGPRGSAPCALIADLFRSSLMAVDTGATPEVEYAERQGRVFIPRLRPLSRINRLIETGPDHAQDLHPVALSSAGRPLKMNIGTVGDLSSIYFDEDDAPDSLGASEVLIRVEETRLLPEDLETVLGKTSRDFVGTDVLGTVVAVGSHLAGDSIQPGTRVAALAPGAMKQLVKADRRFVRHATPDPVTSPSAALTAYYALHNLGDLAEGETVFVHAAASVYGQAALRYTQSIGAVAIAGATGEQSHLLVGQCGLEPDMIVDTARDDFPAAVLRLTAGKGADVVFNPSPENVDGCIECAGAHGHIIQLAHHSLPSVHRSTRPTPTYHVWDLWGAVSSRPKALAKAFAAAPPLPPALPTTAHDLGDLQHALEALRASPLVGERVVRVAPDSRVRVAVKAVKPVRLDPKATYVLVGGLGGLGRSVARLMVGKGARHLAFLSRSAGGGAGAGAEFVRALRGEGVDAQAFTVDICDLEALRRALAAVEEGMPAIKGAIQAAAVLKDAVFENTRYEDWEAATRPKTVGSWHLHQALPAGLDFFVFLSSAAGVIGNRGQASYAAGNGFQDALARYRSRRGQPSVSLDLGPVLGAGMVAEDDRTMDVLRGSGFFGLRLEDFHFLVDRAMMAGRAAADDDDEAPRVPAQVVSGVGTGGLLAQNQPADPYWARTCLFSHLNQVDLVPAAGGGGGGGGGSSAPGPASADLQAALRAAPDLAAAARAVCAGLVAFLARSLSVPAADLDEAKALGAYGVDSLVATNIRGWVFRSVGVKLTDLEVMGAGSIAELARGVAEKGGFGAGGGGDDDA